MDKGGRVETHGNLGFSEDVTLHEGPRVRVRARAVLIRRPDGSPHSIRLKIDRWQRAGSGDAWPSEPTEHIPLDGSAFDSLLSHMVAWREALPQGRSTRYVTVLIDDNKPDAQGILSLLSGLRRNPKAFLPIIRLMEEKDTQVLQAASNLARMRRGKAELAALVDEDPLERELQSWFEAHPWIFGSEYVAREDRRQFDIEAQGDFIMRTADGFLDLFELKRVSTSVLTWDPSHRTWRPAGDFAAALGQSLSYLEKLDDQKFVLRDRYHLPVVYPRIRIVIGRSNDWDDDRRRALRRLNAHLSGVEILTFDQVLARADVMIGHLAATLDAVDDEIGPDDEEEADFGEAPSFADVDEIPF
jgi:hypothetical protein